MKAVLKANYEVSTEIIEFKLMNAETKKANNLQDDSENKACFQTDQRYFCEQTNCACKVECKKLIAYWMR